MDIETLFKAHHKDIVRHLTTKEKHLALVEDLVQDAFIKLHSYLQQGHTLEHPAAWLKKVAYNLWIDHLRKQSKAGNKALPHVPLSDTGSTLSAPPIDLTDIEHTVHDCLLGIVSSLPDIYKKAVYFVDIQGIRQVDAAAQLGIPLSTFKSQVQRGRKMVKEGYVKCCDFTINEAGELEGCVKDWSSCKVCSGTMQDQ